MNNYDLTGYISPIQRIAKEVQVRIEEHEGQILMKAVHDVGFDVNQHELLKALAYDREQYKKGYADAMKNAVPLDKLCEWLETDCILSCVSCDHLFGGQWCKQHPELPYRCHRKEHWKDALTKWMEELDGNE